MSVLSLSQSASSSTGTVESPTAGYFIRTVDGYENAGLARRGHVAHGHSDVKALEEGEPDGSTTGDSIGKISKDFNWYIACVLTENDPLCASTARRRSRSKCRL